MKQIVTVAEVEGEGLESLLGKPILLLCANYFYTGELVGVNKDFVKLKNPSIVYQTGDWSSRGFADAQRLHTDEWYVATSMVESYGLAK